MKSLLTVMLLIAPVFAFAQDAKMPAEAKKVIDKYDASVEAAKKVYESAVAKARDQAIKDLKPIQTAETKKGNLDSAMLVKGKVDELSSEIVKPTSENDLAKPSLPSTDPRAAVLLGKWRVSAPGHDWVSTWEFKEGNIISRAEKIDSPGKYNFDKDKVTLTWTDGGGPLSFKIPKPGTNTIDLANDKGMPIRFERLDPK